ncbi:MAG: GntR family transcriptional regulator [Candidatus Aminicenantaceae bacterium]
MNPKTPMEIQVDAKSALPVYEQVKRAIKLAILSGDLAEGDRLMSIRELALKLRINPNTIIKVYYQLEAGGFVYSRPGAGYFVRLDPDRIKRESRELFEQLTEEYISQAAELGYSLKKAAEEIARRQSRGSQPKGKGG